MYQSRGHMFRNGGSSSNGAMGQTQHDAEFENARRMHLRMNGGRAYGKVDDARARGIGASSGGSVSASGGSGPGMARRAHGGAGAANRKHAEMLARRRLARTPRARPNGQQQRVGGYGVTRPNAWAQPSFVAQPSAGPMVRSREHRGKKKSRRGSRKGRSRGSGKGKGRGRKRGGEDQSSSASSSDDSSSEDEDGSDSASSASASSSSSAGATWKSKSKSKSKPKSKALRDSAETSKLPLSQMDSRIHALERVVARESRWKYARVREGGGDLSVYREPSLEGVPRGTVASGEWVLVRAMDAEEVAEKDKTKGAWVAIRGVHETTGEVYTLYAPFFADMGGKDGGTFDHYSISVPPKLGSIREQIDLLTSNMEEIMKAMEEGEGDAEDEERGKVDADETVGVESGGNVTEN